MGAAKRRQQALGADYGAPPAWAWHYTLGRKIPRILTAGELRDAWTQRHPEMALLGLYSIWFSTSDCVDPTSAAACTMRNSYANDPAAFKTYTGGHWRVGIEVGSPLLLTYQQALGLHPPHTRAGRFLRALPRLGENRKHWRVALEPVPLTGCRIEELVDGQWMDHPITTLSRDQNAPGYGLPSVQEVDFTLAGPVLQEAAV